MHLIKGVRKLVGESDKRSEKASGRGLVLAYWAVLISVLQGLHVVTML